MDGGVDIANKKAVWTCTDPDSYQWQGDFGDGTYQMFDTIIHYDKVIVSEALIDLEVYTDDDKREALNFFGYQPDEVNDALLAECLFENMELYGPWNWTRSFDNEFKARNYIDRQMERYGKE